MVWDGDLLQVPLRRWLMGMEWVQCYLGMGRSSAHLQMSY